MNTNKKAVLGFAVAMVFSLAFMQGNSMKSTKQDINVQQVAVGALYLSGSSESGGATAAWAGVAAGAGYLATQVASTAPLWGWTPPTAVAGAAISGGLAL